MNKHLTVEQIREQIRASIKRDSAKGIWISFWRDVMILSD